MSVSLELGQVCCHGASDGIESARKHVSPGLCWLGPPGQHDSKRHLPVRTWAVSSGDGFGPGHAWPGMTIWGLSRQPSSVTPLAQSALVHSAMTICGHDSSLQMQLICTPCLYAQHHTPTPTSAPTPARSPART